MQESTTESQEPIHSSPISIRHFLYWTAGVALSLWLYYGNEPPKPKNLLGFLLVSSSVTYCIVAGGAIGFLAWNFERAILRKSLALCHPGAKYVALLGVTTTVSLLKTRWMSWNWTQAEKNGFLGADMFWVDSAAGFALSWFAAVFFAFGVYWVRNLWWRIALSAMLLRAIHSAYLNYHLLEPGSLADAGLLGDIVDWSDHLLHFVPMLTVTASLIADRWSKSPRDWTHYFGVLLCILLTIEYLLVQIPLAIRQFFAL